MKPEILRITSSNIMSSSATATINTKTGGMIYYLCMEAGYPTIDSVDSIIALNNTKGTTGTITSVAQTVYVSNIAQINYLAVANLSKLSSSTNYKFYAVQKT